MRALLLTACGAHKIQEIGDSKGRFKVAIAVANSLRLLEVDPEADISPREREFEYIGDIPLFQEVIR